MIDLVPVDGPALISCTGGTYVDEATGGTLDAPDTRAVVNVDGDTVFTQEIGPISVDNTRLPSVMQAAVREIMQSSRQADIAYELSDPGGRSLDLMVTYSTDGGTSWLDATVNGDIFGRNSAIYQGSFIWDFGRDLEGLRGGNPGDAAFLKITPVSDDLMGTPKILQIDLR